MKSTLALAALLLCVAPAAAQFTRLARPGALPPPARIADLEWLAGTWQGDGPRGARLARVGNQITGQFTGNRDGIGFDQNVAIVAVGGSLEYRLQNETRRFALVAVEDDAWYFDGLTIRRDGPDELIGAVRMYSPDGWREAVYRYRRVRGRR